MFKQSASCGINHSISLGRRRRVIEKVPHEYETPENAVIVLVDCVQSSTSTAGIIVLDANLNFRELSLDQCVKLCVLWISPLSSWARGDST